MSKAVTGGIMVDIFQARRFLKALVGTEEDPRMVFQIVDDRRDGNNPPRPEVTDTYDDGERGNRAGTIIERARVLSLHSYNGGGVFFQVGNSPRRGSEHEYFYALVIDDDLKSHRRPLLNGCPPSAIVRSSKGKTHYYWFLKHGEPFDAWLPAMQHLAKVHDTDPAVGQRTSLVMRLPGFLHNKPGKPVERCELIELHPERRYTIAEVVAAFPYVSAKHAEVDEALNVAPGKRTPSQDDSSPLTAHSAMTKERVIDWLDRMKVRYTTSPLKPRQIKLAQCPFNPAHTDAMIVIRPSGAIWAGCFHDTCAGNKQMWREVKQRIGGWIEGLERGDHTELATKLRNDLRGTSPEELVCDGGMHRYDEATGIWEPISQEQMEREVMRYGGTLVGSSNRSLKLKHGDIGGVVKLAKTLAARSGFFRDAPKGACFTNGFLTIANGKPTLQPFSPSQRTRNGYDFAYEAGAEAPRWFRYLREVFEGDPDSEFKIMLLQEFIGACVLGLATQYQTVLFLVGDGANGKSVTLDVIGSLFPQHMRTAVSPQDIANPYYKAFLQQARINLVTEVPERDIFDTSAFKAVADGSETLARNPYEKPVLFRPIAGHVFACNQLPGTADFSSGFWRRALVLTYNRKFEEEGAEIGLGAHIASEERAGVLAWALTGAVRLIGNNKYTRCESAVDAKATWRTESDPVAMFVREACEPVGDRLPVNCLYQAFKEWARDNGHREMSKVHFGRRLGQLGFVSAHTEKGSTYPLRLVGPWAHFNTEGRH